MYLNSEFLKPGQTIISPEGDCVTVATVKIKGYHVDVDCVGYPMILLSKGEAIEVVAQKQTNKE